MTTLRQLQRTDSTEWPLEAGDVIVHALRNGSGDERQLAAELASEWVVMNDELAGELLAVVEHRNSSEELRATAAIALGAPLEECDSYEDLEGVAGVDQPVISQRLFRTIQHGLRAVYEDATNPQLVRRRALEASVRAPLPWHAEAVAAAQRHAELPWRLTAVFCMGFLEGFDDDIVAALDSDEEALVFEAIRAAGIKGLAAAGPAVLAIATSEEAEISLRLGAIEALGTVDVDGAEEMLLELCESPDEELAEVAEWALALRGELEDEHPDGALS